MKRKTVRHRAGILSLILALIMVISSVGINVSAAAKTSAKTSPATFAAAASGTGRSITVGTQKKLSSALKSGKYSVILVESEKTRKFTVPKGKFTGITLVVLTDGATVTVKKGAKLGELVLAAGDITVKNSGSIKKISNRKYEKPADETGSSGDKTVKTAAGKIGYITSERTTVESKYVIFDIEENVYVAPYAAELADLIFETMEKVSGLSVENAHNSDKIVCHVNRNTTDSTLYENWGSAAATKGEFWIAPSDFFVEDAYTFTHELGHSFDRMFADGFAGTLIDEGFTMYTEMLVAEELIKSDPDIGALYYGDTFQVKDDMEIYSYEDLFEQPVTYWMSKDYESFDFCGNGNYCIGFRLMAYLDEVYGNYTGWINEYNKLIAAHPEKEKLSHDDVSAMDLAHELVIDAIKAAYGDKVIDDFYPWVKKNIGGRLDVDSHEVRYNQFTAVKEYTVYPFYYWMTNETGIGRHNVTCYDDLTVYIAPAEFYLREYKGEDTSKLTLEVSEGTVVERYGYDGKLIDTVKGPKIPLSGVASVKLTGKGQTTFRITGYNIYYHDSFEEAKKAAEENSYKKKQ